MDAIEGGALEGSFEGINIAINELERCNVVAVRVVFDEVPASWHAEQPAQEERRRRSRRLR